MINTAKGELIELDAQKKLISVVIPVTERTAPIAELYRDYKRGLDQIDAPYEVIYVLDGDRPNTQAQLQELQDAGEPIRLVCLAKQFGDSTALSAGLDAAEGDYIFTLPAFSQVQGDEIAALWNALGEADMIVGSRVRNSDSRFNSLQSKVFSSIASAIAGLKLQDAGCEVRLMRRAVADELTLYGDLHRFLPILAHRQGFTVREGSVSQSDQDQIRRVYPPGTYLRRLLDLLTVFFLVKFTKKPLRFFGLIGSTIFMAGALSTAYIVGERLFGGEALASRPALLLAVLLIVLGVQIIAIGLVGEIVIFSHAKDLKDYAVDRIVSTVPEDRKS